MSEDISAVQKILYDLFKYTFITNCQIDDDSVTKDELLTITQLDVYELLENLKDILVDLLNFKRDSKSSDKAEVISRCTQFEQMLQKLEGEVRQHISVQHQLSLHLESQKHKINRLKQTNSKQQQEIEEQKKKIEQLTKQKELASTSPSPDTVPQKDCGLLKKIRQHSKSELIGQYPQQQIVKAIQQDVRTRPLQTEKQDKQRGQITKNYTQICNQLQNRPVRHVRATSVIKKSQTSSRQLQPEQTVGKLPRNGRIKSPNHSPNRRKNSNSCDFDIVKNSYAQLRKNGSGNLHRRQHSQPRKRIRNLSNGHLKPDLIRKLRK